MSTDAETVAAILDPHYARYHFTVEPGDKDGDVLVRAEGDDARWVLPQCAATLREAGIQVRQDDDQVTAQLWPYDAVRHDPLTALRIPVVRHSYPGWKYEVCVVITEPGTEDDRVWGSALRPDDRETAQLVAALEWRMLYYNESWKAGMRKRDLDVDGSTNTVIFQKRGEGAWAYRRASWTMGPHMVPTKDMPAETLEQVLDRCWDYGGAPNPKWREFKTAHPEAFAGAQVQR